MKMKKLMSILAVLVVLSMFAGCATKDATTTTTTPTTKAPTTTTKSAAETTVGTPEPTSEFSKEYAGKTVTIFSRYAPNANWSKFTDLVLEKTGIIVNGIAAPTSKGDLTTKLAAVVTTGDDTYDLFTVDETLAYTYQAGGFLAPIDDAIEPYAEYFSESIMNDVVRLRTDSCYLMPQSFNPLMFYINVKLFNDNNLKAPTTKDEFIQTAKALTKDGVYGLGAGWASGGYLNNEIVKYIYLFGGDFYNWSDPKTQEAIQFMYDCIYTYGIVPQSVLGDNFTNMYQKILENQYGMVMGWNALSQTAGKDKFGTVIQPVPYPTFNTDHAVFNCWGMALNNASKNKEAATEVLKVWASFEGQKVNAMYFDGTARLDVLSDSDVIGLKVEAADVAKYAAGNIKARPMSAYAAEIEELMESNVSAFLSKQMTLEECCNNINARLAKLK